MATREQPFLLPCAADRRTPGAAASGVDTAILAFDTAFPSAEPTEPTEPTEEGREGEEGEEAEAQRADSRGGSTRRRISLTGNGTRRLPWTVAGMAAVALIAAAAVSVQLVALTAPTTTEPGGTAIAVSDAPSPDASYTLPATATPPAASTPPDASTASATAPAATPSAVTATQSTHNPPVSSRPSPMPIDAQPVPAVLVDPASGRCLNVDTADSSVGLRSCDGRPTQQWVATAHAELRTQDTGLCLAPSSDAVQPGTRVMVRSCTGSASQQWTAQSGGSLFNPSSGLCLDVLSGYTNSTAPLQLWTCA